ncbi:GyrI-like domain-containing protein [Paenibacillus sp. N1-5-1-14]|uniref:GyrI-like domain-containing protein n=1 Tax=Paenibacillus radicibacter TaxID=2972488 RepID=UPI0021592046|nr:GyrI-like domain-containing protein [Paenibacillus radicibacter]MCR8642700.1 GyrI-like domain-containing protein [Paenibacillus radicibacter]
MTQANRTMLVTKEAFQAIGLKWEGTFAEASAGGIRAVQTEFKKRLGEIKHVLHPESLLGLSYHITEGGFTHYVSVEVDRIEDVPEDMHSISVPTMTYAKCEHKKGQQIDMSYNNIYAWIENQGYQVLQGDTFHFEIYPMANDPYSNDPEFVIMIAVDDRISQITKENLHAEVSSGSPQGREA